MSFRNRIGIPLAWIVILAVFAFPATKIVQFLAVTLPEEQTAVGAPREEPMSTKTPFGKVLHAIDTESDMAKGQSIYRKEREALPDQIQAYLDRFFELNNKFAGYRITLNDYTGARYFITASPYVRDYLQQQKYKNEDVYRAQEVIPSIVLRLLYNALPTDISERDRGDAQSRLLDLTDQYLKSIAEPREQLSVPGAMAVCLHTKIAFEMAAGGFLKDSKKDQLEVLRKRIVFVKEKYQAMVGGEKALYQQYAGFLEVYEKAIEKKKNEDSEWYKLGLWDWERWWKKNIPNQPIPDITKGISRAERRGS